jgi:hypothetical protein
VLGSASPSVATIRDAPISIHRLAVLSSLPAADRATNTVFQVLACGHLRMARALQVQRFWSCLIQLQLRRALQTPHFDPLAFPAAFDAPASHHLSYQLVEAGSGDPHHLTSILSYPAKSRAE